MFRSTFIICASAVSIAAEVERGERLLLHSDVDTAATIQMLISQVDHLNAQYGQLSAENAQLRSDVNNLTSKNAKLTSDMAVLNSQFTAGKSKGKFLLISTNWSKTALWN